MKKYLVVAIIVLLSVLGAHAQTGNTSVTIVAAPSLGTVTPTPAHFYQNTAAPISLASSTSGFNSTCTATAGATALPLTFNSTTGALSGTLTAAMTSSLGSLAITINCTPPALTMNTPALLPNAKHGTAYSASLVTLSGLSGGIPPYVFSLASGSLPAGLSLSSAGVVSGTPSGVGSFNFGFMVVDSSGQSLSLKTRS